MSWQRALSTLDRHIHRTRNVWCGAVIYCDHLNTGTEVAAVICSLPGPVDRVFLYTGGGGHRHVFKRNRRHQVTVVGCTRHACMGWQRAFRTLDRHIHRTGNVWRGAVVYRDHLYTCTEVTTVICSLPGPVDRVFLYTCGGGHRHVFICDRRYQVAVVRRTRQACMGWQGAFRTLDRHIHRTRNVWRGAVIYRDHLNTCTEITAVICSLPGPVDRVFLYTGGGGHRHVFKRNRRHQVTVVGCTRHACMGWQRAFRTLDRHIHRTRNIWGGAVIYCDHLNTGTEVAAVIRSLPGTVDCILLHTCGGGHCHVHIGN